MTRATILLATLGLLLAGAGPARAAGRWQTYIRPYGITDIEAGADSVWFASENAGVVLLDRRDGSRTTLTHEFGGLSSNRISALALDRDRRLWIATLGGGVSRLANDGRWSVVNAFDGLPSDSVTMVKAYGDTVWIGTTAGLAFWNGREVSGVLPDGVNPSPFVSDRVSSIAMLGDSVWVATNRGIYLGRMSNALQVWTAVNSGLASTDTQGLAAAGTTLFTLSGGVVSRLSGGAWAAQGGIGTVWRLQDDHGVVVASASTGLHRWVAGAWSLVDGTLVSSGTAFPRRVAAGAADATGTLFAGLDGTFWLPSTGGPLVSEPAPGPVGNNLVNVMVDGGSVYIDTQNEGLARLRDGVWTNWPPSVCDTCVTRPYYAGDAAGSFIDRDGRKWFSVWSDALEVLDDRGGWDYWTHLWVGDGRAFDEHTWGWATAVDSAGGRWIGSDTPCSDCATGDGLYPSGIDYYAPGVPLTSAFTRNYPRDSTADMLGDQIRALTYDKKYGRMWVGFGPTRGSGGVAFFGIPGTPGGDISGMTPLSGLNTTEALNVFGVVTYGDSVWVMSEDKLRMFQYGTSASGVIITHDKLGPVAEPLSVHPLEIAGDGTVWCAAEGGVRVYHPGGTTEDFTTSNSPLAGGSVRSLRREPGANAMWIATTSGLNRYDPDYVDPPPPALSHLGIRVFPNPIELTALGFGARLTGDGATYRGAVYALDGRRVLDLDEVRNGAVFWNGRDDGGDLVRPGVYFVRVESGGRSATARVVVLR